MKSGNDMSRILRVVRRSMLAVMMLGVVLAAASKVASAQNENATLSGIVADETGARIPGAAIVLQNSASKDTRKGASNDEGVYSFPALPPGTYTLTVTRQGFKAARQTNITLHPTDDRNLDVLLRVGATSEEITVNDTDEPPDSGKRSALISANDIEHLSVQGRDVSELVKNQAGFSIAQQSAQLANGTYDPGQVTVGGGLGNYSANGAQTGISVISDGADVTDPGTGNSTTQNINQEMVQEVKIDTSAFGADQAKGPIVLTAVGKSGGQDFHGEAYVYFRSHALDTQNWFSKNQGLPDAKDRYLYPGAQIGGPVFIPGTKFNSTKKLTFFVGAEDYVQRGVYSYGNAISSSVLALVPTAAMRMGNFSQAELANYLGTDVATLNANCTPTGSLAPYIHLCQQPTGTVGTGPIVGGQIVVDPGAAGIFNTMPLPNRPTQGGFNYVNTNFENNDLWQLKTKIDDNFSDKLKITGSYNAERGRLTGIPEVQYYSPANGGPNMGGINTPGKGIARVFTQSLSLNATYIFTPTMTNEAFASAALNRNDYGPGDGSLLTAAHNGYPYQGIFSNATLQTPQLGDYGYDGLPIALFPDFTHGNYFQHTFTPSFGDNLTKVYKAHQFKAGVYVQRVTNNTNSVTSSVYFPTPLTNGQIAQYYLPNGLTFKNPDGTTGYTVASYPNGDTTLPPARSNGGNYLADFAIGTVSQFYQQNKQTNTNLYYWNTAFFLNDTYKLSRRLTLNAGLRFDHLGAYQDDHGNGIAVFTNAAYRNPKNLEFPGLNWHGLDGTLPNSGVPERLFFYSPRAGLSWDPYGTGKTIVTGGWGMYRSQDPANNYAQAAATAQGIFTTTSGGGSGISLAHLNQGTTSLADCVNQTLPGNSSHCPSLNAQVTGLDASDDERPLSYTYNFAIKQATWKGGHIDLAYAGSQTKYLLLPGLLQNVNALPIGALFKPDPLTGTFSAPNSNSIAQQGDFRPYHPYLAVFVPRHQSYSNYNALQVSYNKRSGKLRYDFNYTFSKTLGVQAVNGQYGDPFHIRSNYGPLASDRSNIFNATYSYDLGERVRGHRWMGALANNWEVSGITNYQSGFNLQAVYSPDFKTKGFVSNTDPITGAVTSTNISNTVYLGTPEVSLQPYLTCDPVANLKPRQYVRGECFALHDVGTQNGPYIYPYIHGPAYFNTDLTLLKNFPMGEKKNLQLRFAAFNVLNHAITSFSGRFPNESNLYFTGATTGATTLQAQPGNCSAIGSQCFGYAGYKQGRRVVELAAKYSF